MPDRWHHISSAVVMTRPEHVEQVALRLGELDDVEVHGSGAGKIVIVIEGPTAGHLGDILLAEFTQYVSGLRTDVTIDRSGHALVSTDETAFRSILRADSAGRWNGPMLPRNGSASDSMSWCVTLEARA